MHIVQKGGTVYRAGDRAAHLLTARQGMLKSVVRDKNRTQLVSVHIPGDALAVSAIKTGTMAVDIVAVTPTMYCSLPTSAFTPQNYARLPALAAAVAELQTVKGTPRKSPDNRSLSKRVNALFANVSHRLTHRAMDPEGLEIDLPHEELAHHFERDIDAVQRALEAADDAGTIRLQGNTIKLRRAPVESLGQARDPLRSHQLLARP
jgi:CRP-like cAMP-binding protein